MSTDVLIDVVREAFKVIFLIGAPVLFMTLVVGLISGFIQSAFQVQDNSVSLVPRLLLTGLAVVVGMPWYLDLLVEYTRDLIMDIPSTL